MTDDNLSVCTDIGGRSFQEDRFFARKIDGGWLMAVFDGHGGIGTSETASAILPGVFKQEWKRLADEGRENYPLLLRRVVDEISRLTSNMLSGSTASIVFVTEDKKSAHIAVLGDSPVIVERSPGDIVIGPEHNVRTNVRERRRAEARGGYYQGGAIWLGMSYIQMSRALGDSDYGNVLSHEPEIVSVELGTDSIVVICSDGVFQINKKAKKKVAGVMALARSSGASGLVRDALDRQTSDNATAVVWKP